MKVTKSTLLTSMFCCFSMICGHFAHGTTAEEYKEGLTRGIGGITQQEPSQTDNSPEPVQDSQKQSAEIEIPIQFGLNSAGLSFTATAELEELSRALEDTRLRDYKFQIKGHTCDLGSATHNMELSKRRSYAVADWLTAHTSLSPEQFEILWFGESCPIVPNTNEYSRRKNRRVIIRNTGEMPTISSQKRQLILEINGYDRGGRVVIADGDSLPSGGKYAFSFKTKNKPYAYVCQMDASGKTEVLFPNASFSSQSNPVQPGTRYTVPDNSNAFYLDKTTGREQIVMLAVEHPLDDPLAACRSILTDPIQKKIPIVAKRGVGGISSGKQTETNTSTVKQSEKAFNLCETVYGGKSRGYSGATRGLGGIVPAISSQTNSEHLTGGACQGYVLKRFFYHQ